MPDLSVDRLEEVVQQQRLRIEDLKQLLAIEQSRVDALTAEMSLIAISRVKNDDQAQEADHA